jgi:hypothetical protein
MNKAIHHSSKSSWRGQGQLIRGSLSGTGHSLDIHTRGRAPTMVDRTTTRSLRGPGQLSRYSDSLQGRRAQNRIPVKMRSSAPVQTGSVAHSASYTMFTGSLA